jgi:hypothetical protein
MKKQFTILFLLLLFVSSSVLADRNDPITGARFDSLIAAQNVEVQKELEKVFPESEGFFITGPLNSSDFFDEIRIICPNIESFKIYAQKSSELGKPMILYFPDLDYDHMWKVQYRRFDYNVEEGIFNTSEQNPHGRISLLTIQSVIYQLWINGIDYEFLNNLPTDSIFLYPNAVWEYLYNLDTGTTYIDPPKALDYNLPEEFDLYAPSPDYVIDGYQNYKDFLYSHAEIKTEFVSGITAFIPIDETLQSMKDNAPKAAFPNKEWPKLQEEYKKFFERGGDIRVMQTLTAEGFDTLQSGEYFFAVGLSGKVRFGRELLREEVDRIEKETGKKVPRANHAFLFPGEPILTAGAFFIDEHGENKLIKVNAQSGHYFYSNVSETIREDIAERSDYYLSTLGHFFKALDRLGISYENILISKL